MDWWQVGNSVVSLLIGAGIGWAGLRASEKRGRRKEARERAELERLRQREREEDLAKAPHIEVVGLEASDAGTTLTVINHGASPASNLSARFDVGLAAGYFPLEPNRVAVVQPGGSVAFESRARPIHFLNHYLFGAGDVPMRLSWTAPHLHESQELSVRIAVKLPLDPQFPVVD